MAEHRVAVATACDQVDEFCGSSEQENPLHSARLKKI